MKYVRRVLVALDNFVADWWLVLLPLVFWAGVYWADAWWIDLLSTPAP